MLRSTTPAFMSQTTSRSDQEEKPLNRPMPRPKPLFASNFLVRLFLLAAVALSIPFSHGKDVPYKGQAAGIVIESNFIGSPEINGAPFLAEKGRATGHFNHVGKSEIEMNWLVSAKMIGGELCFVIEGTFLMTTRGGDSMYGRFNSVQLSSSPEYAIEVIVEGGTGRFRNAHGSIPGRGIKQENQFGYNLQGILSY